MLESLTIEEADLPMETSHPMSARIDPQRFQTLIAGISDYAIYMLDPDGLIHSWNSGAQRFKGYTEQEVLHQHFSLFFTEYDRLHGLPEQVLAQALAQGRYESEGWRVRKDGGQYWAHIVIDPVHDADGALMGFAKITRDVTEKKRVEDALRDSEQRFRRMVQGVTDYAMYMLAPDGVVTDWNAGAERIAGYAGHEVCGQHFARFFTEQERLDGVPERVLAAACAQGRTASEGWRVRKDGSRFWAHVVTDVICNDDGRLLGYSELTRDLTEKKAAAAALEKAQAALFQAQKMESIGQLTGGIAHDFNNLLSVISSGLEVLGLQRRSAADLRTIESMRRAVERGATMNQQLLAFARQQPLEPEVRNVNRILRDFEPVLRRAAPPTVEFTLELCAAAPDAVIDVARLESAVLNLVVNARDAMPDGGRLTISTSRTNLAAGEVAELAAGAYVCLSVSDSGSGMPPDVIARACEPFYTTKDVGKGTGLGLAQVYGFIKQSGGELLIHSQLGQGATVAIYLPAAVSDQVASGTERAAPVSETVLIVEDEPDLLDVATSLFLSMGYEVMTASSGREALKVLASRSVDVLFTDVVMPNGMDGIELAAHTREHYPNVKVLLASGYPQPALRQSQRRLDGYGFVNKPYLLSDLARSLRSVH